MYRARVRDPSTVGAQYIGPQRHFSLKDEIQSGI